MLARMSVKTMPVPQTLMVTLNNPDEDTSVSVTQDDPFSSLKALAEKLHLETKKPSHMEWRFQLESQTKALETSVAVKEGHVRSRSSLKLTKSSLDVAVNTLQRYPESSSERLKGFASITEAVEWLGKELVSSACHFV